MIGAGDGPCVVLMTGARVEGGIVYPVSEVAARHGASVEAETDSPTRRTRTSATGGRPPRSRAL